MRQHNSGAVEYFILPYFAVYLRIQQWKNYWNQSTFARVIIKIKVAPFLMAHGVYANKRMHYTHALCTWTTVQAYICASVTDCVGPAPKRRASLKPRLHWRVTVSSTVVAVLAEILSEIGHCTVTETIAQTRLRFVVDWLYNKKNYNGEL